MKKQDIKIYSPENIYKQGVLSIFKRMVENLINSRELIWQFFLRDFKARYKQSLLGWLWIFLMPLVTIGTFLLLDTSGIIRIGDIPVPYPIFGLLGISLWQIVSTGWSVLTESLTAGPLLSKINFPRETLVVSSFCQVVVEFSVRLLLLLILYLFYGLLPSIWILLLPLYVLPLFFLTLGLGFLTSLLNVVIRDTKNFVNIGMNLLLFLTPIMYTMPNEGLLVKFNKYNLLFFLINTPRGIIISGRLQYPLEFLLFSLMSFVIFLFGWLVFCVSQTKLAERI